MNVRELHQTGNFDGQYIDGFAVSRISKTGTAYAVWLKTGECVEAKGHDRLDGLHVARRQSSTDRIRRYGEFGSSI